MDQTRDFDAGTVGGCAGVVEHPALAAVGVVDAALTDARGSALWQLGEDDLVGLRRSLEASAARLAALTLAVTREIDVRGAAVALGAPSTAHWLAGSLRVHPGAARREVLLAHALVDTRSEDRVGGVPAGEVALAATGAALAAGTVSYAAAGEVARAVRDLPDAVPAVVRERGEAFLLEQAGRLRVDHLARLGQHLLHAVDPEHAARLEREDAERVEARELTVTRGSGNLRGRLDSEAVEELLAALDPLAAPRPGPDGAPDPRTAARRRADALVELIHIALGCGELPHDGGELPHLLITVPLETLQSRAEGERDPGGHRPSTDAGGVTAPERAAVRAGELPDGTPVTAESGRRVGCDAVLIPAILNSVGMVEAMGRSTRAIPRRLRRALVARDRGCAFPGCDRPSGWCQGHHVVHWAHGGRTDLDNLVLVCAHHHRVLHHGGWGVHIGANGLPVFTPPRWIDPDQTPHTRPWRTALDHLDHLPLRT